MEHRSADGYPVEVGKHFWDNDLQVVKILELEYIPPRAYLDSGETATWHKHTRGSSDTLTGHLQHIGRMARYFEGLDAEDFEPGTRYGNAKLGRGKIPRVWLGANDPESHIDAVPYATEGDAKRTIEHSYRLYYADEGVDDVTFEWRELEPPWEGIQVLYVNGEKVPASIWMSRVFTFETATKEEVK